MVTPKQRLFAEDAEHDACGIGAVVSIDGKKSRETVDRALSIVEKLEHRAGKDADGETGDGVGILTQIPHAFFAKAAAELGIGIGHAEARSGEENVRNNRGKGGCSLPRLARCTG